jgi:pimeloyl-ACP methyl ester carboxylesterase
MRRREALQIAGAAALSLISASPVSAQTPLATKSKIIMVHGSWHWGACFEKMSNLLAEAGYAVATPDLTSHGYDEHAYDSFSTMGEYVQPIEKMLQNTKEPVVLVGHSMGGATLTYLGEKYPEKISKLIYLTAFMVPKGKTAQDYIMAGAKNPTGKELFALVTPVNGGRGLELDVKQRDLAKAAFYGDCSDHDVDISVRNCVAITSSVPNVAVSEITSERFGKIPRIYIECTLDKAIPIETQRLMMKDVPGAKVVSIATSHSSFFSKPAEVAKIIAENA